MAIREARWDCQYCGTTGILGRHQACSNCGRSRPEGTKFYLSDKPTEVKDEKLIERAKSGADWTCAFCGSSNDSHETICQSCQAPRDADSADQQVKDYALGEAPTSGDMADEPRPARPASRPAPKKKSSSKAIPILSALGAILLVCLCLFAAFVIFGGQDVSAQVAGFSWDRTIDVENFTTVTEEDWDVPSGGRTISQQQEIHHYEEVLDHYETREREVSEQVQVGERTYVCGQRDLGNGFFEDIECTEPIYETQYRTETYQEPIYREEPVYQTKYTYEIDKWVVVRTEEASGSDHNPNWPAVNISGGEREGERRESYIIYFVDEEGKEYSKEFEFDIWRSFESGQEVELEIDAFGNLDEVNPK